MRQAAQLLPASSLPLLAHLYAEHLFATPAFAKHFQAAMRDLAEQIHGLQVDSSTTVIDLMVQNDTFRGVVSGTIRGARTVRINPTGSDTYEVVLEIDREMIGYLLSTARQSV